MAVPAWFDYQVYRANKLADLQEHGYQYDAMTMGAAFVSAGFTLDAEGMYKHFEMYGNSENISPNSYFDADYYYQEKAAIFFQVRDAAGNHIPNQVTAAQVQFIKDAFAKAGLSAWDHYTLYGMKEGIDPNANFNTDEYLDAKLALLQADDPSWTRDGMIDYFKSMGLNPVSHYLAYGINEQLSPTAASHAGVLQNLTINADNLVGTMGDAQVDPNNGDISFSDKYDNYFNAEVVANGSASSTNNTLQSEDIINGLAGNDTLYARVDVDAVPAGSIEPTVIDVETILFRSQIGKGDESGYYDVAYRGHDGLGDVYGTVGAVIDADRVSFTDGSTRLFIGSDNSRADLTIEDLRHDSNLTTVRFADADPGINYYLYFDPQHLKAQSQNQTGILQVELMDVRNGQLHDQPLRDQPWSNFTFGYKVNGVTKAVTLDLTVSAESNYTKASATYDSLLKAFQEALDAYEDAHPSMKGIFTISLGTQWTGHSVTGKDAWEYNKGYHINIESNQGTLLSEGTYKNDDGDDVELGWGVSGHTVPSVGGIVWDVLQSSSSDCPLIEVGIQLDNVGRVQWDDASPSCLPDDVIYGSNAGDLQVGSMALRGGVERMDVTVDRGSWLKGLYSTNDTLRMVTVKAEDINGDGIAGYTHANGEQEEGQLYIGTWEGNLDDEGNPPSNLTWTDAARLLNAAPGDDDEAPTGLKDVCVFDADKYGYTGQINIAAQITDASYDKYLKDYKNGGVDSTWPMGKWAPISGYEGKFSYLTGTNDDVVNMTVAGDIAADIDFKLDINTGKGDDLVAFRFEELTEDQAANQKLLKNIDINTGDGNDTVWSYSKPDFDGKKEVSYLKHDDETYKQAPDGSWGGLESIVYNETTYDWNKDSGQFVDGEGNALDLEEAGYKLVTTKEGSFIVDPQGLVNIYTGSGRDVIYANQVELTTGGSVSQYSKHDDKSSDTEQMDKSSDTEQMAKVGNNEGGVTIGPDFYNAVFAFNTKDYNNDIGRVDSDGFNGATLNNDVLTGSTKFSFNNTKGGFDSSAIFAKASSLFVTVEFMGFKAAQEISNFAVTSYTAKDGSTHYKATVSGKDYLNAETINHAIMDAIENDTKAMHNHALSDVLSAKDGAGHTLLIESLINGKMSTSDLTIGLEVRESDGTAIKDFSSEPIIDNAALYQTEFAVDSYGISYSGNNYQTDSQSIIEGGAGEDVIVLNENGKSADSQAKDILVLKEKFGNDTVFDFQTGTDKINVKSLGLDKALATESGNIKVLVDNNVCVITRADLNNLKSVTQSTLQKAADDGLISFDGDADKGATAVIAVQSGLCYTVAVATKDSNDDDHNATISIVGSLTFDANHSAIDAGDFTV